MGCPSTVLILAAVTVALTTGQLFTNHRGPWNVVFKIPHGAKISGHNSIVDFWKASGSLNTNDAAAKADFSRNAKPFKSTWLDDWDKRSFSAVRMSAYKNNKEAAYIVFDSMGMNKNEWLNCDNIIDSSFTDITSQSKNYCTMKSGSGSRNFFINHHYGGCNNDIGWFIMRDYDSTSGCSNWDPHTNYAYTKYATGNTKSVWGSGHDETADCFVVSVMAWDMVFKGVEGVAPPQGGLRQLWQGSDTLNSNDPSVQTLTWAPGKVYKSTNVEKWRSVPGFYIESVKYAMFNGGKEVAFSIYDGRDTDKNGWFVDPRILYSRWTDIKGYTKVGSSIDGDGTRRFALWKEHGGCPNDKAWMAILDSSDNSRQPCSWDKNVRPRPYFLYSNKRTWALCQRNNRWNSGEFPQAETMAIFVKGWRMVMKVAHAQSVAPASGVFDLWTGAYTLNEFDSDALTIAKNTKTYKSSVIEEWSKYQFSAVRVSYYKDGVEKAYVVFDAHGAEKNTWFDCSRILYTSYDDLTRLKAVSFCSGPGDTGLKRRFFIQNNYGGCNNDAGWMLVVEKGTCAWERRTSLPYFVYSGKSGRDLQNNFHIAEIFMISVVMDNCEPNPCQNGGTCFDEGMDYTCTCSGDWFGQRCTDKNGGWSSYGNWGACTKSCAGGTQTRTRTCTNPTPLGAGAQCSGSATQTQNCNTHSCAVHGNWGNWGSYGSCSKTCGSGTKTRSRSCNNPAPAHGGNSCSGSSSSSSSCNTHSCPIDGNWGNWGSWGSCSRTCGGGSRSRSRACNNPAPAHGGSSCSGSSSSLSNCNTNSCPIDGNWGNWGSWGSCSRTCGGGSRSRSRACNNPAPAHGGSSCSGSSSSLSNCNTNSCPIDGNWGNWASWGSCSLTCGGGTKVRSRSCNNPAPQHNGKSCSGSSSSSTSCNTLNCPIDGNWGNWASWGTCSLTCGGGTQDRSRSCSNPAPRYNGKSCSGSSSSRQNCNTHNCPIDGNWASWGSWGTCTVTCGGGTQDRSRTCTNPQPQYGGSQCGGSGSSRQSCNTHHCPIDGNWGSWTAWGTCTVTCGGGTQDRSRTCTNPRPQYGGAQCPGSASSRQNCNTHHCPIDGVWSGWSSWGACTVTCGGGTQDKTRTCTNPRPQYGGADCTGASLARQDCNTQVCIIDGAWGAWSAWGSCSVTCGGGQYSRSRNCDDPRPANGGLPCSGDSASYDDCNTQACPTVAAGTYQQLCPTGWFTCQAGGITCIDEVFKCDCSQDCDDGSDETEGYAACTAKLMSMCGSGAISSLRITALSILLPLLLLFFMRR